MHEVCLAAVHTRRWRLWLQTSKQYLRAVSQQRPHIKPRPRRRTAGLQQRPGSRSRSAASQGSLLLQHGVCPYLCEQNAIPQRLVLRSCLW